MLVWPVRRLRYICYLGRNKYQCLVKKRPFVKLLCFLIYEHNLYCKVTKRSRVFWCEESNTVSITCELLWSRPYPLSDVNRRKHVFFQTPCPLNTMTIFTERHKECCLDSAIPNFTPLHIRATKAKIEKYSNASYSWTVCSVIKTSK